MCRTRDCGFLYAIDRDVREKNAKNEMGVVTFLILLGGDVAYL